MRCSMAPGQPGSEYGRLCRGDGNQGGNRGRRAVHVAFALPPIPPVTGSRKSPVPSWGKPLPYPIVIADRRNNRLIEVTVDGRIVWEFPSPDLATYRGNEDVNFSPDGRLLAVSEEDNYDIDIVDYDKRALVWTYGTPDVKGGGPGLFNYPDDAHLLEDGTFRSPARGQGGRDQSGAGAGQARCDGRRRCQRRARAPHGRRRNRDRRRNRGGRGGRRRRARAERPARGIARWSRTCGGPPTTTSSPSRSSPASWRRGASCCIPPSARCRCHSARVIVALLRHVRL